MPKPLKNTNAKSTATDHRAGRYIQQPTGYKAFIPNRLPPEPSIELNAEMQQLLHEATLELGRLDAATLYLPNPNLFLSMYVRKEALLSSQIEGTQASLDDVLELEAKPESGKRLGDATDVVNYVKAMNYGLERINSLPLSMRLIREIHSQILSSGRGTEKRPGEFRKSQNWIGPAGSTLSNATFVPPPVHEMKDALANLEQYMHSTSETVLIRSAVVHAQFETIHPFLDGNGRVGRLLITFMLCHEKAISRPLLYLSYYFKANRQEYYDRLMDVRFKGAWEAWITFFLMGVRDVSKQARETATRIIQLQDEDRRKINESMSKASVNAMRLLEYLFLRPIVTAQVIESALSVSQPTANSLLNKLESLGILEETTKQKWGKTYRYKPYLEILREGTSPL